jgi:predicted Zn-dependent protease
LASTWFVSRLQAGRPYHSSPSPTHAEGILMARRSIALAGTLGVVACVWAGSLLWSGSRPDQSMRVLTRLTGPVYVVAVEPVSPESLLAFAEALGQALPLKVQLTYSWRIDERKALSWDGDVYDVDQLLDVLWRTVPRGTRVIGVTDQPVHDEDHWWLYGKAGDVCIVSTAHLWRDEWSDHDPNDPLFRERLTKVGVHEFGHSAGFHHCDDTRCVMHFCTELWMLDATEPVLCRSCVEKWLKWN